MGQEEKIHNQRENIGLSGNSVKDEMRTLSGNRKNTTVDEHYSFTCFVDLHRYSPNGTSIHESKVLSVLSLTSFTECAQHNPTHSFEQDCDKKPPYCNEQV